jgi:MoaA/NifB/PqqE/SkfB family radical SAM enzyme
MDDEDGRHGTIVPRAGLAGGILCSMWTEEAHSAGVADKARSHEEAAHDRRNWVRLTYDCNDHCVFCLDSDAHDGTVRPREEVKRQILDGRRAGATRLILSGGEPTIHPDYVEMVRLGRLAGYPKIQTVTNGRMFAYGDFLVRCLDAGLSEITFSLHGPNARVHDALVGTKGAFEEEMKGLRGALADGRPIVNVDVVVNRANVRHLPEMLRMLTELGVKEFDLLQVVPFGRASKDGRDTLFYDLAEARPYLQEALAFSKRPDVHIWMNRFPPQHLEGYEHLIQDPYKLHDEVRGRKEELTRWIDDGVALDCREPGRCRYCYLERLCNTLEATIQRTAAADFEVVRVDTEAEAHPPSTFGGDPAAARKRLPLASGATRGPLPSVDAIVARSRARTLSVVARDAARARSALDRFPTLPRLELRLEDWSGLADLRALREVVRVEVATAEDAQALLDVDATFEVVVDLTRDTATWLLSLDRAPDRLALRQPTYERLTDAAALDVDLRDFFARFPHACPVEGVVACILGREPRARPAELDVAATAPAGGLEIFRWTRRYVAEGYRTRSLRCEPCVHAGGPNACDGMHVSWVRAHGYAAMRPVEPRGTRKDDGRGLPDPCP